jgi:hypothetical protein
MKNEYGNDPPGCWPLRRNAVVTRATTTTSDHGEAIDHAMHCPRSALRGAAYPATSAGICARALFFRFILMISWYSRSR